MFNNIKIGEKVVPMLCMASTDLYYRHIFHRDAIKFQMGDADEGDLINFVSEMGFVMAKYAELKDRKEMLKLNEDAFLEWLDGFERADFIQALPEIRMTYEGQQIGTSDAKKNNEEPSEN